MEVRKLLLNLHARRGESRFKARDVYDMYLSGSTLPPAGEGVGISDIPDALKHHVVVDLRKLRSMGLLGSKAYKGRWEEYWITQKGLRYIQYLKLPSWEKDSVRMARLATELSPHEREFAVAYYLHGDALRAETGIEDLQKLDQRKYSKTEKEGLRVLASWRLAEKYGIGPERHWEIIRKLGPLREEEWEGGARR
jgi:hypothetical protein